MKKICVFCGTSSLDDELGPFYQIFGKYFHSNCLVFSSDIRQSRDKTIGLHGFDPDNIQTAVNYGQERKCIFCSEKGATIRCEGGKKSHCGISFHLPCALDSETTVHVYYKKFDSYCSEHNPFKCIYCRKPVTGINFVTDCCKRIYSHEECLKENVMDAEALSKCPLCLNDFNEATQEIELKCAAEICKCPRGRLHHEQDTEFELVPCANCGSDGIHQICGRIRGTDDWICKSCDPRSDDLHVKSKDGRKIRKRAANIFMGIKIWFQKKMCILRIKKIQMLFRKVRHFLINMICF
ncbi:PHD finger protein 7-like [Planococcus citri]|uniref:PHD finger protein 7-like n=1 Tax=Planococcus citri TaxID=170843 RepID=UPI0031F837FD